MPNPSVSKVERSRNSLITFSHGRTRQGLVKLVDFTPVVTPKKVKEMSKERLGALYNIHDGGTVKLDSQFKNERHLVAALMDRDPNATNIYMDQKRFRPFHVLVELLAEDEKQVIGGAFALKCLAHGIPEPMPAEGEVMLSVAANCEEIIETNGQGIRYVRIVKAASTPGATPGKPSLATAAAASTFVVGDMVSVQLAQSNNVHAAADPAPTSTEPLTVPCGVGSVPIIANGDKVVATFAVAVPAGKSFAVYVGRTPETAVFYKWAAAADVSIDILGFPDLTQPTPIRQGLSGAYQTSEDLVFAAGGGGSFVADLSLGALPIEADETGIPYFYVIKNGTVLPRITDTGSPFGFSEDRKTFIINETPLVSDVWELVFPYQGQ